MSLFEPGLQNLVKLDTVKGRMWEMQMGTCKKGDRFAEMIVHSGGQANTTKG